MKLSVVTGSEANHVSGSKICTNQCEPGVCMEHARYPGGSGGDASMQQVANTFQECRWGRLNNSDTIRCGSVFHPGIIISRVNCAAASNVFDTE